MATGDQADFTSRILRALPQNWFPTSTTILNAMLQGPANACAWTYSQIQYVIEQTRIATATGAWLDLIAADFYGTTIARSPNVSDAAFRATITANFLLPLGTRPVLVTALQTLTGNTPQIRDLWSTTDCGAANVGTLACGVAGNLGNLQSNGETFVTIAPGPATTTEIYATCAATIEAGGIAWVFIT